MAECSRRITTHMLLQDLRFGVRTALKNKGVTGLAVTCLAIGIGLNTMMFSVTDGVLIQPLPYHAPDRLVVLHTTQKQNNERFGSFSWLELKDWQERARSFSAVAGIQYRSFTVSDGGDADRYAGAAISHQLFPLLGKSPSARPRLHRGGRSRQGAEPRGAHLRRSLEAPLQLAIPRSIGRAIQVNARPHTVIGVMPPQFRFPENQYLWLPLSEFARQQSAARAASNVFARLRDGVTLEQAQQEADAVAANLAAAFPDTNEGRGACVRAAPRLGDSRRRHADHLDDDGRGHDGAADRVLQRRQPDAGARVEPIARDVDPHGARRRARPDPPPAADRERHRRARSACRSGWRAPGAASS